MYRPTCTVSLCLLLSACSSEFRLKDPGQFTGPDDPQASESETASDAESDTESDSDVETDTEPPTDTDVDTDTEPPVIDEDGDGYPVDEDCDDDDADINPGATEVCDEIDNDCDGDIDDDDPTVVAYTTWYEDDDEDGFGNPDDTWDACEAPDGYVEDDGDCDDDDGEVNPDATEVCDGVDNDCDDDVDDDDADVDDAETWYADNDEDGFGDEGDTTEACEQPDGYTDDDDDCDDDDDGVNPDAIEVCDAVDNDCDGDVDDDDDDVDDPETWYADADADGFGDASDTTEACEEPSGYVENDDDCDDDEDAVNPDMPELCNGFDDDCNGDIDDDDAGLDDTGLDVFYFDGDSDGYGADTGLVTACSVPSDYTDVDGDCDDGNAAINPDESESCNGIDDDCDGVADSSSVCPCNVEYDTGDYEHVYLLCETEETWTSARAECASYDYHLVTIDNTTEDTRIDNLADSYSTDNWWIGLNDRTSEGTFTWEDGSTSTYTNWHSGEPNDYGSGEDCVELNRWSTGTWNDNNCSNTSYYVCEAG